MAQVTVEINGRSYRMACEEGQERHLTGLATTFDGYVAKLKGSFGEIGDGRLTVMAAIMVTDEMQELRRRLEGIEAEMARLRRERESETDGRRAADGELRARLDAAAARIEALAMRLQGGPDGA